MCFGAAFLAANSSSSFKVRKVLLTQHPNFDIALRIRPLEGDKVETADSSEDGINYFKNVTLYKHDKDYLGQKKTISLTYDVAMEVEAFAQHEDGSEELLQTFRLADLVRIADLDVMKGENSTGPKASLQFELSRSHLLKLVKAEVKTEETKMEEILPEPVKKDKKKKEAKEKTDEKAEEKADEKAEEKAEEETSESQPEEVVETEKAQAEPKEKQFKEVKVPHTFPCEFEEEVHNVRTLDKNQMKEAKKRLGALEKRDEEKYKLDESKNEFETVIYAFRAWLSEDENFVYIPEELREKWLSKCSENEDWLYDEGASAGYKAY